MRLSTIARRNVRRHLARTALLVGVITVTVGVVMTLYLVTRSAEQDLADAVDEYGANIVVAPRSEQLPLAYGGVDLGGLDYRVEPLHLSDLDVIRGIEDARNINVVAPKLLEAGTVGDTEVLVVGVGWEEELTLKRWWRIQGREPARAEDVLLGSKAAERLGLSAGDRFELRGTEVEVAGVIEETGGEEDDLLFADLATVQRLWERGDELSFIEVSAYCSTCPIEKLTAEISAEIPDARVSAVLKAAESRELLIGQFRLFGYILSSLMIAVGGLIVLASTLGSVRDRREEIGIFRAVGFRRRHIFWVILLENLVLALIGGLLGIGLAVFVQGPVGRSVAGIDEGVVPAGLELVLALAVALLAVAAATLYPAWRASRLSPTLAMREV